MQNAILSATFGLLCESVIDVSSHADVSPLATCFKNTKYHLDGTADYIF